MEAKAGKCFDKCFLQKPRSTINSKGWEGKSDKQKSLFGEANLNRVITCDWTEKYCGSKGEVRATLRGRKEGYWVSLEQEVEPLS